jgi:hypothetical protein
MAKRRGRAVSLDGLVAQLSALDKHRETLTNRLKAALSSLGVPSPFSPHLAGSKRWASGR